MKFIILYSILFYINIFFYGSILNLLITIPEALYVLYLLLNKHHERALFWHLIFTITSASNAAVGDYTGTLMQYNYFSFKLIGPISLSYLFNIIFFALYAANVKKILQKHTLFYKLYKIIITIFTIANILGGIGLIFYQYSFEYFVNYNVYIINILLLMFCLLRINDSSIKLIGYKHLYYALIASICASWCLYFVGATYEYGGVEVSAKPDMLSFAFLLIAGVKQTKHTKVTVIIVLMFLLLSFISGTGGKSFIFIIIASFFLLNQYHLSIKNISTILIFVSIILLPYFYFSNNANQLFNSKLHQFVSLFNIFSGNIDDIDRSPYIRVASFINIYYENLKNIVYFLFGRGYGGYFTDSLNLFNGIDLYNGAFPEDQVSSGHFYYGHSTFIIVPLLNGFGGLFLLFKIVWQYIKRIQSNYYALASILWIVFMFYYNVLIAIIGLFFLYCSDCVDEEIENRK